MYYPVPFNDFDNIKESCFYSWGDSGAISNVANKPSNLDSNAETLFYCYELLFTTNDIYYIQIIKQGDITYKRAMSTTNNIWDNWEEIKTGQKIFNCGENDNLPEIINRARRYKNSIVYVDGTHDLIEEMADDYGTGIQLDNNIHIIFSSTAKVTFHYTGSDTAFMQSFSIFNTSYENEAGYILENVVAECSRCRYVVHDDLGTAYQKPYKVKFLNCNFKIDNTDTTYLTDFHQCIGGGLGACEYVEIDNCIFNSVGISSTPYTSDNHAEVSYHNVGLSYGKSNIFVKNSYFTEGGFLITNYGTSTSISTAYVNNCSFKYKAWFNNYSEFAANVNLVEYNNITRESLLWENPNKNVAFASTSLSVPNLDLYKYYKVVYAPYRDENNINQYKVETFYNYTNTSGSNITYTGSDYLVVRSFRFYENTVYIGDCTLRGFISGTTSTDNNRVKPIYIYGTNTL